jgi:hypothetical protein
VKFELGFYIPEDGILHSHRRENSNSDKISVCPVGVMSVWNKRVFRGRYVYRHFLRGASEATSCGLSNVDLKPLSSARQFPLLPAERITKAVCKLRATPNRSTDLCMRLALIRVASLCSETRYLQLFVPFQFSFPSSPFEPVAAPPFQPHGVPLLQDFFLSAFTS